MYQRKYVLRISRNFSFFLGADLCAYGLGELVRSLPALLLRNIFAVCGGGDQLTVLLGDLPTFLVWYCHAALLGDLRTVRLEVAVCDLLADLLRDLLTSGSYSVRPLAPSVSP